jgi:hypothetical protein
MVPLGEMGGGDFGPRGHTRPRGFDQNKRKRAHDRKKFFAASELAKHLEAGRGLLDAIDLVLESPELAKLVKQFRDVARKVPARKTEGPNFASKFSSRARRREAAAALTEVDTLLLAAQPAIDRSVVTVKSLLSPERREETLLWFLEDPGVPAPVAAALLSMLRIEVELAALHAPVLSTRVTVDELAAALRSDVRRFVAFIASFEDAGIGEEVIPASERLPLRELDERQAEATRALESIGRKA